jgi:hypothetical protein
MVALRFFFQGWIRPLGLVFGQFWVLSQDSGGTFPLDKHKKQAIFVLLKRAFIDTLVL